MRRTRMAAAVAAIAMVLAACGGLNDDGNGGAGSGGEIPHPTGADELVLRVEYSGGFIPYEYSLKRVPSWSLYGDGRLIVEGPVIEIYPGPALPNLQVTRLSEDGVQAILAAAKDGGLMDGDATYDYPCVTDAASTVFTTNAGGSTSVVSAYALGDAMGGTCQGVDDEARQRLVEFQAQLGDLASFLPEGSIGSQEPYAEDEMRVYVLRYQGQPDLPQEPVAWPLSGDLASFGDPFGDLADARCGAVTGTELDTLGPLVEAANELTPWDSGGERYRLVFRPLLPDEHGC